MGSKAGLMVCTKGLGGPGRDCKAQPVEGVSLAAAARALPGTEPVGIIGLTVAAQRGGAMKRMGIAMIVAAASVSAQVPPAAPDRGARNVFQKEAWGVSFAVPAAWRAVEKDGAVLVVSDTEAGLILVNFVPRSSRQEMLSAYREGLRDPNFVAMPVAEAADFEAAGGAALAGLLEGRAQDGATIRVRSIGVLSRFGGALVVLGLTTPQQFANLHALRSASQLNVVAPSNSTTLPFAQTTI